LNTPQLIVCAILVVAFAVLITEKLRTDVTAMLVILSLYVTGVLDAKEAVSGFASEPAIVVAAIFVITGALHQTGVSDIAGRWVASVAGSSFTRIVAVVMPVVAVLSAFTHHVTTTAAMLPVALNLSREHDIPPSKLLMPLSFAASLGTAITIIGAPAFLIASGILERSGRPPLGVFSIAPIGIALSIAGTLFVLLFARFLLPSRRGTEESTSRFKLEGYLTEVAVLPDSPLAGKTVGEIEEDKSRDLEVLGVVRRGQQMGHPRRDQTIEAGDVLVVSATPDEVATIREESGVELAPVEQYVNGATQKDDDPLVRPEAENEEDASERFVQAVVAPNSDLIGRTIGEVDFRRRYGAVVISFWRRGAAPRQEMSRVRLRGGDVLVLQGDDEVLARIREDRAFLMMTQFHGEARERRKAWLAAAIMVATVLLAAFSLMELRMAVIAGAVAVVLTRCISSARAYRAIDQRIFVFIAGAIPLGTAMEKTKTSEVMGQWLQGAIGGWNQFAVLFAVFAVVAVLTQFMSDAATTAIFGPVAVALATALGARPEPFVVTVAMAAVVAFLTPIGHHGNLLIYGPGGYQFADFVKVGTPLTVICGLIVVVLAPLTL
jgi:di/tricarboxylate transporter